MPMRSSPGEKATREFFIPATQSDGTLTNLGDYPAHLLSGTVSQSARMAAFIPWDFKTLLSITIMYVDTVGGTVNISIATDYGAVGEAYNANSGTIGGGLGILTAANLIAEYEISTAVANLAANDYLGVAVTTRGNVLDNSVYIIGLRIRYE